MSHQPSKNEDIIRELEQSLEAKFNLVVKALIQNINGTISEGERKDICNKLNQDGINDIRKALQAKDAERERAVEEAHQAVIEEVVRVIEGRMEEWAALEHDRWRRWQRWVHSQSEPVPHNTDMPHCFCNPKKIVVENGNMSIVHSEFSPLVIPFELVARWERQIATPYAELSEAEKESDREQVRPYITDLITKLTNL